MGWIVDVVEKKITSLFYFFLDFGWAVMVGVFCVYIGSWWFLKVGVLVVGRGVING